jgi:hypothetical protein
MQADRWTCSNRAGDALDQLALSDDLVDERAANLQRPSGAVSWDTDVAGFAGESITAARSPISCEDDIGSPFGEEAGAGRVSSQYPVCPESRWGHHASAPGARPPQSADPIPYALETEDSNLCIPGSAFAKTLSLGGGTRTSASGNQIRCTHCRTSADLMLSVGRPPTR